MDVYDKIIETKTLDDFTHQQIESMKLLAANTKEFQVTPFGSAIYKIQPYAADLDLLEDYKGTKLSDVLDNFLARIGVIVENIELLKNHWFSEFKAGANPLSSDYLEFGPIYNGLWKPDREKILNDAKNDYYNNILSKKDLDIINKILSVKNPGADERDSLKYLFRERVLLRWNAKEVINHNKILPGNLKYPLINALQQENPVKIDMITVIDGRLVEVTNFYKLILINKDGEEFPINSPPFSLNNVEENIESLKDDIQELYFSNIYYSPFKCAKRMWSTARQLDLKEEVLKLTPLVTGDISLLYQLRSIIGNILRLLKLGHDPKRLIDNQIKLMIPKLESIKFLQNTYLEDLLTLIEQALFHKNNKEGKTKTLRSIEDFMKFIIQVQTIQELDKIGMNPPPQVFLPQRKYYGNVVRTPYDTVENPLQKYGLK